MAAADRTVWDPQEYLRYADQRGRAFTDLVARVGSEDPAYVVDLGCGPGTFTADLAVRWPNATVTGVDASPEMIAAARPTERLSFQVGDLRDWHPDRPVDVLISNATLQWVPGHLELLPALVAVVAPGGWFAFQVPGNFEAPSHRLLRDLAAEPPWSGLLADQLLERPGSHDPEVYLGVLAGAGCEVDAWEATYFFVLAGEDPVLAWMRGTGLRPYLQALASAEPGAERRFEDAYAERLREAYPRRSYGTVLPYRRVFAVARKPMA